MIMNMNNIVIQILIAALFIGYTGYFTAKSFLLNREYRKELEKFKSTHKHVEQYDESKMWTIVSGTMAVFALVICVLADKVGNPPEQLAYYQIAYGSLGIMFAGLALETNVRKRIWFADEGFFFVNKYYRYRMIMNYKETKSFGIFRNVEILMGNTDRLNVSGKMADQIKEREAQWKEKKKQRKKHR